MTCTKNLLLTFLILLLASSGMWGQNSRPKVGLVLSGGGAKGIAHIGVLKAMEEAGLKPDYITGTSMGSIVGGLYSLGYSADELEKLVTTVDWDQILTNKVPLNNVIFEEKDYYGRYLFDLYLNNKELIYPSGVIDGQALITEFSALTRPAHSIHDFSQFPIPFACVATDIVTGEPVLLNKGSLALSMRASMAIPSVFTPVRIDGKLLVDGGLVRNLPVQEVIDMGADIIIAVYVGGTLQPEDELKSLISILTQSAFITSVRDAEVQKEKCDYLILPNLGGYSSSDFHHADSIVARGIQAGRPYVETFRHLADSLRQLGPLNEVAKPNPVDTFVFDNITLEGNHDVDKTFVLGRLGFDTGQPVSIDDLNKRIDFIFGTQYFNKVYYEILGEPGRQTLKITVSERPPTHLRMSYHYESETNGGIVANMTFRNLLLKNSRLIFEADVSGHPEFSTDYFKYLGDKQMTAFGANILYNSKELPWYNVDGDKQLLFRNNFFQGGIRLQATSIKNSTYGIEMQYSAMRLHEKIKEEGTDNFSKIASTSTRINMFYRFNNLNDRYFPTSGMSASVHLSSTVNTDGTIIINDVKLPDEITANFMQFSEIFSLKLEASPILQVSERVSLLNKTRLCLSTVDDGMLNLTEFDLIGGFSAYDNNSLEFYGAKLKEYQLANYFFSRVGAQFEIKRNLYIQAHLNLLSTEFMVKTINPNTELGTVNGQANTIGYGLVVGMRSPIGPVEVMVAKNHDLSGLRAALRVGFY